MPPAPRQCSLEALTLRLTDDVVEGSGRAGRLVTSAALILGLAFVAMSAGPGTGAKTAATALGAASC